MEELKKTFTKIYEENNDALFRYCYYRISDRDKAKDLVQEVFTKTWGYVSSGNRVDNMRAFLYTTARHAIIDEYRKKKTFSLDSILDQGVEVASSQGLSPEILFDAQLAKHEILKLPESYRDILFMKFVNDLSVRDIALSMKLSENVVSVRIHRGLHQLRKNLNKI